MKKSNSLLDLERSILFNKSVPLIKALARKRFGYSYFIEEIEQVMLLEYAMALAEADLERNYEAYCCKAMNWAAQRYLRQLRSREHALCYASPLEFPFDEECSTVQLDIESASINETMLIDRMLKLYARLKTNEKAVLSSELAGINSSTVKVMSYDKRKRILRF